MHVSHSDWTHDEHRVADRLAAGGSVYGAMADDARPPTWLVFIGIALTPAVIVLGAAMVAGNWRW